MLTLIQCPFHPRVIAVARKRPRSFCQKCKWQQLRIFCVFGPTCIFMLWVSFKAIHTFTYRLTARVVGALQMIVRPVFSIFFSLFSTALWDLANSRPVHSLMLSSHLFFSVCLVFFPRLLRVARWFWPDLMNGRHVHMT